jgi:hypothetical protein
VGRFWLLIVLVPANPLYSTRYLPGLSLSVGIHVSRRFHELGLVSLRVLSSFVVSSRRVRRSAKSKAHAAFPSTGLGLILHEEIRSTGTNVLVLSITVAHAPKQVPTRTSQRETASGWPPTHHLSRYSQPPGTGSFAIPDGHPLLGFPFFCLLSDLTPYALFISVFVFSLSYAHEGFILPLKGSIRSVLARLECILHPRLS